MKVLIVAQYFPPDITAAAFRIYDMARLLEAQGHEVHVITTYPHRASSNSRRPEAYDGDISGVWRTRVTPFTGGGFLDYVRHYASFMVGSSWLGLRRRLARWKPDVIWASSPPLFVGLSGAALSRIFGIPLVMDIRDIWPASAVGAGQLSEEGRAYRLGVRMEQYVYDRAAHVTCVARPMQDYIRSRSKTPVTVVYNGTRAADLAKFKARTGSEHRPVLLYAGNLGRAQQLDLLVRAWGNLSRRNRTVGWTVKLLGSGALEDDLRKLAVSLDLKDSIVFSPPVSREEAMRQMSIAGALFISLQPNKAFERTIPSKVFDCMAVGKPILAGVLGEGRSILESTGANPCYEPGCQQSLEQALETLIEDYPQWQRLASGNPRVVRDQFTRQRAASVLAHVLDAVLADRLAPGETWRPLQADKSDRLSRHAPHGGVSGSRIDDVPCDGRKSASAERESTSGSTHG